MTFEECMKFLIEINKYSNVYLTIDNGENMLEEYLFDDLTIRDLQPFLSDKYNISFDGTYYETPDPVFRMVSI